MRGSVRSRGDDNWQVRVSLGRDPSTGKYEYATKWVHGTKRDAQRAAAALVAEVERGSHRTQPGRHSVAELLDEWMAHIEAQGRAARTMARYRSAISANIKPHLGSLAVNKVGPADLDRFYGKLTKAGLGPLSVRKSHAILSAAFNQAVKWGWLDVNPVLRASPPSTRGGEIHPPSREELQQLLEACADSHEELGSLIFVAATSGARRSELCGLRWSDLDLDLATMTISRSISDAGREVAVKGTKTHQARRRWRCSAPAASAGSRPSSSRTSPKGSSMTSGRVRRPAAITATAAWGRPAASAARAAPKSTTSRTTRSGSHRPINSPTRAARALAT